MKKKKITTFILTLALLASAAFQTVTAAFSDVPDNSPYKAAIDYCQSKNLVNGISSTQFNPEGTLTRMQLAIVWSRFLGADITNHHFSDVTPLKNSYDSAAILMNAFGILTGTSGSTFSPYSTVTREQLAVIVQRTFGTGVANSEDYKRYGDHTSISTWARDAVSSCLNADVFAGLYNGTDFMPQRAATRAEVCQLIYNLAQPGYTVTIGPMIGGTVTALPSVAHPGTTINLTIIPDTGKQLKTGTLKFNDTVISDTAFTMPAEDVVINADFEDKPFGLESISVTTPPPKSTYTVGEALDLSGMVVTAVYTDNSQRDVTGYSTAPASGIVLDTEGTVVITVTYTEGGVTKTNTCSVQVTAAT